MSRWECGARVAATAIVAGGLAMACATEADVLRTKAPSPSRSDDPAAADLAFATPITSASRKSAGGSRAARIGDRTHTVGGSEDTWEGTTGSQPVAPSSPAGKFSGSSNSPYYGGTPAYSR